MTETHEVEIVVPEGAESDRAGETITLEVDRDRYVLGAAREAGLWLDADCRQGWCTRCAALLIDGEVEQSDARRYYPIDEEAGIVLTCTAKPRSDLRLRAFQYDRALDHRAAHDLPPGRSKR